jgi:hypothetical protein
VHHDDPAHVKKQAAEHSPLATFRAIHGAADQNQGADGDGDRSGHQQYVRWTEDGDIETVSVMPPVVEGADMIMAKAPQAAMKAPSGRKAQIRTLDAFL